MNRSANFHATDRDIFDALASNKKKFTKEVLLELCLDRGIIISSELTREEMVEYISMLPHAFNDFDHIVQIMSTSGKTEKMTYDDLSVELDTQSIKSAVNSIINERKDYEESYSVVAESKEKTVIKVKYTEMDYTLTRLKQRRPKEAIIEISAESGITKIRRPENEKTKVIVEQFIGKIQNTGEREITSKSIDLSTINDSKSRTKFFTDLISKIDGMKLDDVIFIKVDRLIQSEANENDIDDNEEAAQQLLGHVRNVALDGGSLLQSEVYQNLSSQGFYISSIVWKSVELKGEQNKYEFEASFRDTSKCNGFNYNIRCFYKFSEGSYQYTKKPLDDDDKRRLFSLLENKAMEIMDLLLSSIETEANNVQILLD